jgi:hypothetical protein
MLIFALDCGFRVIHDEPQAEPIARILSRDEAVSMVKGQFHLFRADWVYGPFQTMPISAGYNRGKYFVQRVNFAPIAVYFQGERSDEGRRRFGSCSVSAYRDWLELPAKVVRDAPSDTDLWFKRIVGHLSSGIIVKAGVHKYRICKGVLADPEALQCLPPFDFIPWGADVLHPKNDTSRRGPRRRRS